jgi:hypothetical protein
VVPYEEEVEGLEVHACSQETRAQLQRHQLQHNSDYCKVEHKGEIAGVRQRGWGRLRLAFLRVGEGGVEEMFNKAEFFMEGFLIGFESIELFFHLFNLSAQLLHIHLVFVVDILHIFHSLPLLFDINSQAVNKPVLTIELINALLQYRIGLG